MNRINIEEQNLIHYNKYQYIETKFKLEIKEILKLIWRENDNKKTTNFFMKH